MSKLFTRGLKCRMRRRRQPFAFMICAAYVIAWACTGPLFGFSDSRGSW